jgi:hypothetical protein
MLVARFGVLIGFEKSLPGIEIFSRASIGIFPIIFGIMARFYRRNCSAPV